MKSIEKGMAVAYIKNGDVNNHITRLEHANDVDLQSGPDAFLFDFLRVFAGRKILLVSRSKKSDLEQVRRDLWVWTVGSSSSRIARLIARPAYFFRILYRLARSKPRRILCGSTGEALWACFLYGKLGMVPVVHSRHNRVTAGSGSFVSRQRVRLDNFCIRRIKGLLCHGPYLKKELSELGITESEIYEFDVSLGAFRAAAQADPSLPHFPASCSTAVLFSGRIEALKGVFDLLEAIEPRLRSNSNLCLLYAGEGSATAKLKDIVASKELGAQVKCLGRLSHHHLGNLMSRCKVVVTPTRSQFAEGRCMVAMESLALGVPVIAPNFGPFPFLVEHGINGLLYEPDRIEDLSKSLARIFDDRDFYERLVSGAKGTGQKLLTPPLTFGSAVLKGFGMPEPSHKALR